MLMDLANVFKLQAEIVHSLTIRLFLIDGNLISSASVLCFTLSKISEQKTVSFDS